MDMDIFEITIFIIFLLTLLFVHFWAIIKKDFRNSFPRICLLDTMALLMVLTGYFYPKTYIALMEEDFIGEWITFYAFAISGIIIVVYLWSCRKDGLKLITPYFLIPLIVAAFCLIVAGEEASWGQRIFAFKPPNLFLEQNYQQELNVHNLFKGDGFWGIQIESKHLVMLSALIYGILFPLLTRFLSPIKKVNKFAPALYLIPFFIGIITMEEIYPITFTGEGCELYMGMIFIIHVFDTYQLDISTFHKWYGLCALIILVFTLGILTAPLLNLVVYGSPEKAEAGIREELRQLHDDFLNPETDKRKILRRYRVHKRIYTAIQQDYFHLTNDSLFLEGKQTTADPDNMDVRKDRKGYFLDPWNYPYWVYYTRNKKLMIFYSFGANRKRDSNFRRDLSLQGDDIGIMFNVK